MIGQGDEESQMLFADVRAAVDERLAAAQAP